MSPAPSPLPGKRIPVVHSRKDATTAALDELKAHDTCSNGTGIVTARAPEAA